jgi:hypothetical protein
MFVSIAEPTNNNPNGGKLKAMLRSTIGDTAFMDITANLTNYMDISGWYATTLTISPTNPNYIYAAGFTPTYSGSPIESFDKGNTWVDIANDRQLELVRTMLNGAAMAIEDHDVLSLRPD